MEELTELILKYASACISLLVLLFTAATYVVNKIKQRNKQTAAEEEKEEVEGKLAFSEELYKLVNEIIPLAMKKCEEMPNLNGTMKKLLALSDILINCNAEGINFEAHKDFIDEQIENLITFSKTINKRKEESNNG